MSKVERQPHRAHHLFTIADHTTYTCNVSTTLLNYFIISVICWLIVCIGRSVGDLVFDIVREVIAETLSGLFARGLGLSTARAGAAEPFSLLSTVVRAVSKVATGKSSCWLCNFNQLLLHPKTNDGMDEWIAGWSSSHVSAESWRTLQVHTLHQTKLKCWIDSKVSHTKKI